MGMKIEKMFAFVCKDDDGNEGVIGHKIGNIMYPLVGADMERIESLKPLALSIQQATGKQVYLISFDKRTVLEVLGAEDN